MNDFGGLGHLVQQLRVDSRVTHHHVRAAQQFRAAQGQQAGVAWAGADQVDLRRWFHLAILYSVRQGPAMDQRAVVPGRAHLRALGEAGRH